MNRISYESRLIALFGLITGALAMSGAGSAARGFFLAGAVALAVTLYFRKPVVYVKFVFWLWFLTPFVRRVVDYRSGWVPSDPILAASLLATLACLPAVWRNFSYLRSAAALPFVLAAMAVAYGFCVGVFYVPVSIALMAAVSWAAPLIFGFCVLSEYAKSENGETVAEALDSSFLWGLLVMGAYSIWQFCTVPEWDAMWLIETDNPAFGTAEPFGVRVFSTMASPLPLGVVSFAGLVLLIRKKGALPMLATLAGYASLALCSVRSTWGLWAIGTVIVLLRRVRYAGRFLTTMIPVGICLVLSLSLPPVNDVLQKRFATLNNLRDDTSFQDRSHGYGQMYEYVFSNPFGLGLGAMDTQFMSRTDIGVRDSGLLAILLSLGWVGGAAYLISLALVIWSALKMGNAETAFGIAAGAISIAMIAQIVLADISAGPSGMVLWTFAAISLAPGLRAERAKSYGAVRESGRLWSLRKPRFT